MRIYEQVHDWIEGASMEHTLSIIPSAPPLLTVSAVNAGPEEYSLLSEPLDSE